jgi:hypothetical protein
MRGVVASIYPQTSICSVASMCPAASIRPVATKLLATPSSPCNDNRVTNVDTPTPTSKRNRKPTLRPDIEDVKRAGLPIRSVQRTPDGHIINIGEPIINTVSDNDNNDAPDRSEGN